ncbi:MAG: hypothetical protein WD716_13370 [Fimbriimonadaceae bacterium]
MKNALVALAALALLAGCSVNAKEELTSSGTKDAGNTQAVDDGGSDVLTKTDEPATTTTDNPLGTAKTDETKPTEVAVTEPGKFETKDFIGMYDGKLDVPPDFFERMKAMIPPEQHATAEAQFKSVVFTLELKAGDRYVQTTSGGGASQTENGKWTYDKAKNVVVLFTPDITAEQRAQLKQGGRTDAEIDARLKESQSATVSNDGRSLVLQRNVMAMDFKMTFTRR